MPVEPESIEEVSWLDGFDATIQAAATAGEIVLESVAEDWRTTGGLSGPETFVEEDAEDRQKLVRYGDAKAEVYALRDDILNRELPPIMEGIFDTFDRAWEGIKASVKGWWALLTTGNAEQLYQAYRSMAVNSGPRGFIGRVNEARKTAEQRLRKKALFAKGERRFQRRTAVRR